MAEKLIFLSEEQVMLLGPSLFRKVGEESLRELREWGRGTNAAGQSSLGWSNTEGDKRSKGRLTRGSVEGKMAVAVILHVFVLA